MKKFLNSLDLSRYIAMHVLGNKHTIIHRKIIGTLLMIIGVCGVKLFSHNFNSIIIHITSDILGYAFHGIGLIPLINGLEALSTDKTVVEKITEKL